MSENGTFGKRSPKGINLKTPAKCVDVDSKNGTFLKMMASPYLNTDYVSLLLSAQTFFSFFLVKYSRWLSQNTTSSVELLITTVLENRSV